MSRLWKSALNSGLHPELQALNASIGFDFRLWRDDIEGSRAHVAMLERTGLVPYEEAVALLAGLDSLESDIAAGRTRPSPEDEDVHAFVERELVARVGATGSNIHIARSRNEQVLLDTLLYLRRTATGLVHGIDTCLASLERLAVEAGDAYMPSYTHLRRAQPMSIARMWRAHAVLWRQARDRFARFVTDVDAECPMGAGAINGTTLATDPGWQAAHLGFRSAPENSLATLSSRRAPLEFCAIGVHWLLDVSRLMEDLVNWSSTEFGFVALAPGVTTGSSMMPQKRNPDICELLRANASVAMGHYVTLMGLLKGLPMGYMKDLQNDKVALFAVVDVVESTARALPLLLEGVRMDTGAAAAAASDPLLLSTDVMEWCVTKGTPLREAHARVAEVVHAHMESGRPFTECVRARWPDFPVERLDPQWSCARREAPKGGRVTPSDAPRTR